MSDDCRDSSELGTGIVDCIVPPTTGQRASAKLDRRLPDYAACQAAYHRAFETDLREMLAEVFRRPARAALDLACGDGAYSVWLSQRFGATAAVVALDSNLSYLHTARRRPTPRRDGNQVISLAADALKLPFEDESFDAVWCAQSLYSLPDPSAVLAEMRRVTRPGGTAAVLENDTLHEIILPWPPDLELALRQAELASFRLETDRPNKFYLARNLPEAFRAAGFAGCELKTFGFSRTGPLEAAARTYLRCYLLRLRQRAAAHLSLENLQRFDRLLGPGDACSFFERRDITFTCLNYVAAATKDQVSREDLR